MTLVLFGWASNEPLFRDLMNADNRKALYQQKMVQIEEELTPFGFVESRNHQPDFEVADGDLWITDKWQSDYNDFLKSKML